MISFLLNRCTWQNSVTWTLRWSTPAQAPLLHKSQWCHRSWSSRWVRESKDGDDNKQRDMMEGVRKNELRKVSEVINELAQWNPENAHPTTYKFLKSTSHFLCSLCFLFPRWQAFAGLNQTGELDDLTLEMMNTPRCGVKDKVGYGSNARRKRYALQGWWTGNACVHSRLLHESSICRYSFLPIKILIWFRNILYSSFAFILKALSNFLTTLYF